MCTSHNIYVWISSWKKSRSNAGHPVHRKLLWFHKIYQTKKVKIDKCFKILISCCTSKPYLCGVLGRWDILLHWFHIFFKKSHLWPSLFYKWWCCNNQRWDIWRKFVKPMQVLLTSISFTNFFRCLIFDLSFFTNAMLML